MIEKKVVTGTLTKAPMIPIDFLLILHMRNVGLYFPLMEHGKKLNLSPGNLKKKRQKSVCRKTRYLPTTCTYSFHVFIFVGKMPFWVPFLGKPWW